MTSNDLGKMIKKQTTASNSTLKEVNKNPKQAPLNLSLLLYLHPKTPSPNVLGQNHGLLSETPVAMYFFPFVGGGKTTILNTTPAIALRFRISICGDQSLNRSITIRFLNLPNDAVSPDSSMFATPSMNTSVLQEPLKLFLTQNPPDYIVIHVFHRWAADVIDGLNIKWVVFNGNGFFSRCISECTDQYAPHEHRSDSEPFLVSQIPDRIVLTTSQLPPFVINKPRFGTYLS